MPSRSWLAMRARATSAPAARRAPTRKTIWWRLEQMDEALRVWPSRASATSATAARRRSRRSPGVQLPSLFLSFWRARGAGGFQPPDGGSRSAALDFTDGRLEKKDPQLRGERTESARGGAWAPGADCIDVSEFKALAQDLFVTNSCSSSWRTPSRSSLLLRGDARHLVLRPGLGRPSWWRTRSSRSHKILDADCFNKLEEDSLRDALLDLRDERHDHPARHRVRPRALSWFGSD